MLERHKITILVQKGLEEETARVLFSPKQNPYFYRI